MRRRRAKPPVGRLMKKHQRQEALSVRAPPICGKDRSDRRGEGGAGKSGRNGKRTNGPSTAAMPQVAPMMDEYLPDGESQ